MIISAVSAGQPAHKSFFDNKYLGPAVPAAILGGMAGGVIGWGVGPKVNAGTASALKVGGKGSAEAAKFILRAESTGKLNGIIGAIAGALLVGGALATVLYLQDQR